MFYRPQDGHGLPHNPFNAIVTPRPIGWISSRGSDGRDNLAPYSFFNAIAYTPPQVMFSSTSDKPDRPRGKDSLGNIEETGVFCVNIVEFSAFQAMSDTSGAYEREVDEFARVGIEKAQCREIDCPMVAGAPAALECRLVEVVKLRGPSNYMAIGEVVGVHMRDDCLKDGMFDITTFQPLARLGYRDYTRVAEVFTLKRPDDA
ncbi:Flavin reductase like domain protein [Pseudoruegeria aquimaris]|uniref:Flavin reductase like domain protein n=1 Tax=Pseudoruegeria aquimaris TaxID=393663 RepID=A0A1Y5T7P3_9RHOB|nr:flavin reductase family protein [Pseudoruegeria aquimaris]SLN57777.1 Flavin reductase like domain protein [Pseudoruegeria aquimaris]